MTVKCTGNKTSIQGTCISKIYQTNKIYIRNYMYSKCKTLNCKNSNTDSFFTLNKLIPYYTSINKIKS